MGLLNSGVFNRFACVGLLTITTVLAAEAKAAKGATCDGLFKSGGAEKIQVPDTRRSIAKAAPAEKAPVEKAAAPARPRSKKAVLPGSQVPSALTSVDQSSMPKGPELKKTIELLAGITALKKPDAIATVLSERHSIMDFLNADETQNIAVRSPFTVMNSAQRIKALVHSQGKKQKRLQFTGELVDYYPFFSAGLPVTNGVRIFGNEKAIVEVMNNLESYAGGDRAGASVILFVGPGGTGKSETLKLIAIGAENLTSRPEPQYASYTYEWTNLGEIPSLVKFIPAMDINGKKVFSNLEAPIGDSPFMLLPPEIQRIVLEKARPAAEKLTDGNAPRPFTEIDPISNFIRNEIIQNFVRLNQRQPDALEIVELLDRHVVVKRQILGQSYGRMPLIDAQGNDIDVAGLFMAPNPVVSFGSGAGPTHVMSWYLNGKVLNGHGNMVFFDEWLRNPEELRNMLLSTMESRKISIGGAPTVHFDAFMLAATNRANLAKVQEDPTGAAGVDRFKLVAMQWFLYPNQIAKLLLGGKMSELHQQSLATEDAPITKANLDELIPEVEGLEKTRTPDYRYRYFFGEGPKKIQASPHSLMLLSEIVSATRMETDASKAEKEIKGKYLDSNLFRNPIDRLRLYAGEKPEVQPDEIRELTDAAILLNEGESGISQRDAARWLSAAIEASRTERTGYTLTPGIIMKTFGLMIKNGSIKSPSTKVRLDWMRLANEIVNQRLIPNLQKDINKALANGDRVVTDAYFDVLEEIFAIDYSPNAVSYTSPRTGQETPIDRARLEEVKKIYLERNGRPLNFSQITLFHARQKTTSDIGPVPDEALLDAIASYHAGLNERVAGFPALVEYERTGTGPDEVKWAHQSLVSALTAMGYNKVSIRDAILMTNKYRSQNEAPKQ